MTFMGTSLIAPDAVRAHLRRLLLSQRIASADSIARLLKYTVEKTLAGEPGELKEYTLGMDVFGRGEAFDPKIDSIVRVQARKLRARLEEYYAGEGLQDQIRIEYHKGSYVPRFIIASQASHADPSLAVLPFNNLGADKEGDYLSDGLTEELILALSRIPGLRVVARTSTFALRGKSEDVREVAQRLRVRYIVAGSVRQAGGRLRVSAELVEAESGFQIWSEGWERALGDVFRIQDELSSAIACALRTQLAPRPVSTDDVEAYQLFLKGRYYWYQRTEHGFHRALEHYEQALARDVGFSRAWAALADTYFLMAMHGLEPPLACLRKAQAAARRSLQLDPGSAETHAALGAVSLFLDQNSASADSYWQQAFRLDPNYAFAWHGYGLFFLGSQRRTEEALAALRHAEQLDPLSAPIANDLAFLLYWGRRYELAINQCQRAIDLHPSFYRSYLCLARCHAAQGDLSEAVQVARMAMPLLQGRAFYTYHLATLGFCLARMGQGDEARAIDSQMDEIGRLHYYSKIDRALISLALGDLAAAQHWIAVAKEEHNPWLLVLPCDPLWEDNIRATH
jgi:TolB-like protein/Flp pilus assembly protein TadD